MAVPKKRVSHSRTNMRRSVNDRLTAVQCSVCPECHEPKLPPHACMSCGKYKNTQAVKVEEYTSK